MKTKNILKIGIFSIVVFALLISPILKFNSPQVKAISACESEDGICVETRLRRLCTYYGDYIESSLSCLGSDNVSADAKCCIPNPTPGQITIRHGAQTINVRLPEKRPEGLCKKNFEDGMEECAARYGWGLDLGCQIKVVIADMWCVFTKAILEGLGKMFSGLINLEIGWILWALDPGTYGGFTENEGVMQIWEMMRNITNTLLILGMIGIAIATIVRYKKYVWQNTLWKLVIVALLVNFSLVIGGTIIDISNYLSGHFLSIAQEENNTLAPRIQQSFGYEEETSEGTKTLIPPDIFDEGKYELPKILGLDTATTTATTTAAEEVASYDLRFGNFFIIGFIMILVGGFAVISLLAVFVTILFRALILIVLLGLSPIVFAAWIFPDTEKYWKMWWEQFIKWCFFPVIFSFTLYIAVIAMSAMNEISIGAGSATQTIIQMVLFSMFLVGGLIFAIQGGGAVSKTVIQQATKAGAVAGAFVGHKALKGAASSETWRKAQKRLEDSKFAPTHDIGVWMSRQPGKIRSDELKQIEEDYKNRTPDQIRADMKLHETDRGRVALGINTLIGKESLDYKKDNKSIEIAKNQPNLNVSGIKKVHPELYAEYFTKPEDMNKAIEQMKQRLPRITNDEAKNRVITNLTAEQLLKSSPDDIKSGNWENILERLEEKGPPHTNRFFYTLLAKNLPAGNFAAMLRSTDNTEKQIEWVQQLVKSVRDKIHGNEETTKQELKRRKYDKNRFLAEFLPF